jgi:hypothetical protein
MTVQDYMAAFLAEHDHPYSNAVILKYINLVESNLDIIKTYLNTYYTRTLNAFQLTLPAGVDFEDVSSLYINGQRYKKKDVRAHKEYYTFWYEDSKVCHYPVCSQTDSSYVSDAGEITFASATITTTGDDFSGFVVGDVVLVSGATTPANNRYATVTGVAAKVLTFATGTWSVGLDAAAVTVSIPKIKLTYLSKPVTKLIANIATDTLNLEDRWVEIYDFFIMAKIAYLAKDYAEHANHQAMLNNKIAEYETWMEDHRPQRPDTDVIAKENWGSRSSSNFDNDL